MSGVPATDAREIGEAEAPDPAQRRLTWLGHATVLIEARGTRLLTDPVLRSRVAHLRRHAAYRWQPSSVDGVLISHVHHDHLDRPSLRTVATPSTAALVPAGAARWLQGTGFVDVREMRAGDEAAVGGLTIRAVPAWHPARRHPRAPLLDSLGYLVEGIWFAGDTDLDPGLEALRGSVDVALVPIWGWGISLGPGHMDPEAAARAVDLIRPRVAVPIHWGTFLPIGHLRWFGRLLHEPASDFARHAARLAPGTDVVTLLPGEHLDP